MTRWRTCVALIALVGGVAVLSAQGRGGRGAALPPPTVLNLSAFVVSTQNLDSSLAFYRDGLGLDLLVPPAAPTIDAARNAVMGTTGARTRMARLNVPGEAFAIELVEYTGLERTPGMARHNDPGSSFLNVGYVDLAATFASLGRFNPRMIGQGTFPPRLNPGGLSLAWIRDPDGMMVEVMQGGWDSDRKALPGVRNAYRAHFGVTMENYRQALGFYRDLLGFELDSAMGPGPIGEFRPAGDGMARMLGVPAEANMTGVGGHCAGARCEMFEFKDAPRTPFKPRPQDPGAALLAVWVSDIDGLLAKLKQSGDVAIVTPGGAPVEVSHTGRPEVVRVGNGLGAPSRVNASRQLLVRDPAGFPVLLMQRLN